MSGDKFQRFTCLPLTKTGFIVDSPGAEGVIEYRFVIYRNDAIDKAVRKITLFDQDAPATTTNGATTGKSNTQTIVPVLTNCPVDSINEALTLVNQLRGQNGLSPLNLNDNLTRAAQKHANTMSVTQNLTHDNWAAEILNEGYIPSYMSQNIASFANSPQIAVEAWWGSEGHRANILSGQATDTGIGCSVDAKGMMWWVENFGAH